MVREFDWQRKEAESETGISTIIYVKLLNVLIAEVM